MEEIEEEENQSQGVIKTVASPTILAAILDESDQDKQTTDVKSQEEKCPRRSSLDKLPSLEMAEGQNDSNLDNSFVADSLEYDERLQASIDEQVVDQSANVSDRNSSLVDSPLRENTSAASTGSKPLNKSVKIKQTPKQKPKETNFIDLNKGKLNRTSGKSSYAAMYSQKLKQKSTQEDVSDGATKGKSKLPQSEKQSSTNSNLSYAKQNSYSSVQERNSSLSGINPLYEQSSYYNVDPSYLQNSLNNYPASGVNQPAIIGYNDYFSQPYHVPYRDFGLRYSNYGHQSYMMASAVGVPRPADNINQVQGYLSQSAPPAAPGRQSLLDQVEFFPEQEHFLSQSLTNSQFINPMQLYHAPSVLEKRFVSEPHLSSMHSVTEKGRENRNNVNSNLQKTQDYKPYTLKDYKQFKNDQPDEFGGLGPETETEEYKEKVGYNMYLF